MDLYRAFLAIVLSFLILIGYQYFFVKPVPPQPQAPGQATQAASSANQQTAGGAPAAATGIAATPSTVAVDPLAHDVTVDTPLYTAVINEQGGGVKGFVLKSYRSTNAEDAGPMQLIIGKGPADAPVLFSLDNGAGTVLPTYTADKNAVTLTNQGDTGTLTMTAALADGIAIVRTLTFRGDSYLINVEYKVSNTTDRPVQVSPALTMVNEPFAHASETSKYLFAGPAAYVNEKLVETKAKKLTEAPVVLQGKVSWTGYVDNYFMTTVAPAVGNGRTITLQGSEQQVRTVLSEGIQTIGPHEGKSFAYTLYFGPKKLQVLQTAGSDLAKAVDFGWFDVLAKPMLWLLNFFHQFSHNYGVAIILLTILIKLIFWPITQKGMKSMKNMQKLQPKIAKLRERFKDDPAKMNQEMMTLYKTYKVNPVGGCLPMLIQIPFFFALYRVLMAAIELRHAPFMLWINDLSAPDRLWIGFDIPYLHGIPILTLLMGASMYLQQKMTPTTADPTQARIMQFLPIVFTFMFINFASGLVLYWFVNNLLSILQQYLINRQNKA
ncbi:protein translocase subunit yidC [Desulfobulbus propionicus DSM 2032]|jgi:YidC/Oxa1 family membrane protein insertase|uniref:Membrane protein insertase YidC n=1 Tax=Desulfobulbus propionicus (strain ATCC 33891 / DSM 2032 / VKM B-1956 / 1pr3) TaxID=577650 RepID=A0A7U3YNR6_DESPD|nr:membrane protein insertase YidC [Desulfobulbus propionicus]ADW18768.1 protein translocase subunit yidC [Desulfobulbus propionicus DSM 2032]